ncbi:MAG: hypothetical protein BWY19_00809 [bacterium ADurb.Bin212]|nr:MAG: hypothetical protein BWY19_00809 [bacterium ADurb.Bin212]
MADIFSQQAYQGTSTPGVVAVQDLFQVCAIANINASNQFECSFWINRNGQRVDSGLGNASYRLRDKAGNLVSGISSNSVAPDVNGYYKITAVSAALIYDLTHYILEIEAPVDDEEIASSIGLVVGE